MISSTKKYDNFDFKSTVMCLEIFPPNKFVKLEDLKKTRSMEYKSLKDLFKKKEALKNAIVMEGYKELFIEFKWRNREEGVKALIGLVEQGMIKNIFTLQNYLQGKMAKDQFDKDREATKA